MKLLSGVGLSLMILVAIAQTAWSGQYNDVLSIGDPAPAWQGLPGVDGRQHALADLSDNDLIAVVFTCNSCPYAVDYEDRVIELQRKYGGKEGSLAVVAINVNRIPEDSLEAMKERAEQKQFNFPYLYDESQQIARRYGALRTPEVFLLDKQRKVFYMGAIDDHAEDAQKVTRRYLEQAIEAAKTGQALEVTETPPVGCAIRYVRQRRR